MQKPLLSLLSFIARPDVKLFGLARYRSMIGIYDGRMDVLGKKSTLIFIYSSRYARLKENLCPFSFVFDLTLAKK